MYFGWHLQNLDDYNNLDLQVDDKYYSCAF